MNAIDGGKHTRVDNPRLRVHCAAEPMTYAEHRDRYRSWASATFTPEQVCSGTYDEAGYPDWRPIEAAFAEDARNEAFRRLPEDEVAALLFLIARAWDTGRMIGWLGEAPSLAPLSEDDAVFLAEVSLAGLDPELDDARYQLATVLPLAVGRRSDVEALLVRFYEHDHEYTKRCALLSLSRIGYPSIVELAKRSWQIDDEYHRTAVLAVLATGGHGGALGECLAEARTLPGEHLAAYCRRLDAR